MASKMTPGDEPLRVVSGVSIPQSPLARDARAFADIMLPSPLKNHAKRVFVFASLSALKSGLVVDTDLLYVASMFINVGLDQAFKDSQLRYEIDGANAARHFLESHGVVQASTSDVWQAVALHSTHGIVDHVSPLASLIAASVRTDLFGENMSALTRKSKDEILRAYPRGYRFEERYLEALGAGLLHRPSSTFGSASADVLDRIDPNYRRINFCGLVLGARWRR
ncbi:MULTISPECIES: HD domain-containing protein [Paraburkholderia]|uniref:phosphohydrolase n=1 Tax=Paraburkholderia TaxID=1822464 RepID=UPI0038B9D23C